MSLRSRFVGLAATVITLSTLVLAAPSAAAVTEFALSTAGAAPAGITSGPDGNLWVAESGSDRLARVTPGGTVTEFTLPAGRGPVSIASAGGFLWFTERSADRVGRIDPAAGSDAAIQASVAEFVVPGVGSAPTGITQGPDGNLWFTEAGSSQIGRLTTGGVVTEFAVPGAGSEPTGITQGPDGNLWFTEAGSSEIGSMTTAGVITNEFAVPGLEGQPSSPGAITQGPDGALWFADAGIDHIRRITTGGAISGFPAPADSRLGGIATGPDGALWLTQSRRGKIARMTTDGTLSEYTLPTPGGGPAGITAGPDGALWFTEALAGRVGRITTDTAPDALPVGPPGPEGPPGPVTEKLMLVAFETAPARPRAGKRLTVRFVITAGARVSLEVQRLRGAPARPRTVATKDVGDAGIAKLGWNGRLGRKAARPGRYRLIVHATAGGQSADSSLRVRLR